MPIAVPTPRWERWCDNFERSHGPTTYAITDGALTGTADDGSHFTARLPFDASYGGEATPVGLATAATTPADWGVLLVRKGGFAMARLAGPTMGESKTGQRHVQGRTKAGGQSQQRFARRRDNQARQAYEAAADHAARILGGARMPVVVGGDRGAVEEVLTDTRLSRLTVVEPWLAVPDPRRGVLEQAVVDACAVQVDVTNT